MKSINYKLLANNGLDRGDKDICMHVLHGQSECLAAYLSSRLWTSSQASWRLWSVYIRNRMRRPHARLLVSCFKRLGLDFPLKPLEQVNGRMVNGAFYEALLYIVQYKGNYPLNAGT